MRNILTILLFLTLSGPLVSQDLYDLEHIPEIRITFQESNWAELLDSMKMSGDKKRLTATVSVDGEMFTDVGVRYKGNSSYKNPRSKGHMKLPFNLKADYKNKKQTFPGGYETIKLSNVFQDASYTREILSYEIARKYMPAPRCNFAKVYVNDKYMGFYNNTQAIDKVLLNEAFGISKGTLFKCDPEYEIVKNLEENDCPKGDKASLMYLGNDPSCYNGWYELESKKKNAWKELIRLTRELNENPEQIDQLMNIDAVLWMHAFNNVLVNLDSYTGRLSHNYYLYKTPDSLFTPLVWDMNISFGGFRYDGLKRGVLDDEELQTYSMFSHYKTRNPKRPLITNILSNPLYRKIYVGHCRTITEDNFANDWYLEFAKKIQSIADAEVMNDPNKLYTYEDFKNNLTKSVDIGFSTIIGVEELMSARTKYLMEHPLFNGVNPEISNVRHNLSGETVFVFGNIKDAEGAYLVYRANNKEPFRMVSMHNDGTGLWQAAVDCKSGMEYYIVAEGSRLAVCEPRGASYAPYKVE